MPDDDINYEEIRQRVEKRYEDLKGWFMHVMIIVVFMVGLFLVFGVNKYVIGFMLLWLSGFLAHTVDVFADFVTAGMRERAIEREIEMEMYYRTGQLPTFMKRKHQPTPQHLQLSDDGELIPAAEGEDERAVGIGHHRS